ncbi:glycosyltransferase family 2 protein [Patescibacteria group bacterium]|nr:glycosyltransferase family 2 protein [Patescibacteria group bacterium]MBU1256367.1 glycosyltransferase family 2 protein [Patescibacteria group bacterium]MBU1457606.1 glycosyltransferase family 2 protein [Patescibacteria group bacterium]
MKSVSVIIATFNAGSVFEEYLKSIKSQDYDHKKIEIIVADGGSTDGTVELAKKYGCRVIMEKTGSPEGAKAVALKKAKNELILIGDSDNIWPSKTWLKKMIEKDSGQARMTKEILAVYPWRYTYRKKDSLMNRYFALLGANDPVVWFLGKTDRQSYLSDKWGLGGKLIKETKKYFVVEYSQDNLPTVGANGFLIRRKDLLKAKVGEKDYFHIDVILDLVKKKPRKFVVLKTDIVHKTGEDLVSFLRKRSRYMRELYLRDSSRRRYFIYKLGRDEVKTLWFSLYALSVVLPLIDAIKGYVKKRDLAWFMHPVMCFCIFWVYFLVVLRHLWEVKIRNIL